MASGEISPLLIPHYNLKGRRLFLERLGPEHVEFILQSLKYEKFWQQYRLNQARRVTLKELEQTLAREKNSSPEKNRKLEWVIFQEKPNENRAIGFACLADYIPASRRAELLIGIVREEDRTVGAALEATLLILEFAFNVARLNKVISYVYAGNEAAQKNTLALGFSLEGNLRQHFYDKINNKYVDIFQNGLLLDEFRSNSALSRWSRKLLGRDITQVPGEQPKPKPADSGEGWNINVTIDY